MTSMTIKAHKLKDRAFTNWISEVEGRLKIADLRADEGYCNDWISLDTLVWDRQRQRLYVGLTAINTDVLYVFDPAIQQFRSLGFQRVSDKFDVKLHRSIEIDNDGTLYLATALLHDVDEQRDAKGGKLAHYDPDKDEYTLLGEPVDRNYIQSILLDAKNRIIYGFTYPFEQMFRYDLNTGRVLDTTMIGNGIMICQPHNAVLDRQNRLWGTWGESRAYEYSPGPTPIRIFCYDPATNEMTWFQHGFPKTHASDTGRVDHMLLGNDGLIYVGTLAGGFSRLNPATGAVEDLGKPYPGNRLAGLVQASNGLIYGAGNAGYDDQHKGTTRLFAFDPTSKALTDLAPISDPSIGEAASNIHILVEGEPGTLYAGENDNIWRSSYLWECHIGQ
jgi:outer membrane protein assembly factor BamB